MDLVNENIFKEKFDIEEAEELKKIIVPSNTKPKDIVTNKAFGIFIGYSLNVDLNGISNIDAIELIEKEIEKYYDAYYNEYYKKLGKTKEELIEEDMKEDLKEKYISAFDYNNYRNNIRMKNNVRLNRFILVTAALIIITYILVLSVPYNETINVKYEKSILMERRYNDEQKKCTRIR